MKISTGGIGAVATAQACNAKSVYPYQWAWNAVGTDLSSRGVSDVIYEKENSIVEAHQYGIKHSPDETAFDSPNVQLWYNDEGGTPPGGNRSGPLNEVDLKHAHYVHLVVDLLSGDVSGWGDWIINNFTVGFDNQEEKGGGWDDGMLKYAHSGDPDSKSICGGVAIFPHSLNSNTYILVWNPRDQNHKQGDSGWGPDSEAPFDEGEYPKFLEFYPGGGNFDNSTDNYLIIMGYVVANRILTDIPLPIKTHMG